MRFLKYTRRTLAAIIAGLILFYFLDILSLLPMQMHGLLHLQVVPAIMGVSVGVLVFTAILTLLFGRVYCSVICPLGVMQDVIARVERWIARLNKKSKKIRGHYTKPLNVLRYGVLAIVAVPFAFGITYPLVLLDPYSNFGRIAVSLMRPVVVWVNNVLASLFNGVGYYAMYNVPQLDVSLVVTLLSAGVVMALLVMVYKRGRLWCNTICPVGAILGLLSRISLFRVAIDKNKCTLCSVCESGCKSHCIDVAGKHIDSSRCVTCFNCVDSCKFNAIEYRMRGFSCSKSKSEANKGVVDQLSAESLLEPSQLARRRFLKGSVLAIAALPATTLLGKAVAHHGEKVKQKIYPLPPGAVSLDRFKSKCTACQLCVDKCPTHVLQPAFMENGLTGMMQPYMRFKTESFCNYECKVCSEVCPNGAIVPLSIEQKKLTRVGIAVFAKKRCRVFVAEVDCGACSEHCPSQAVRMIDYKDGLTIPKVDAKLCIGCGGCESICPIDPPAIHVNGVTRQTEADAPTQDVMNVGVIDDFGF